MHPLPLIQPFDTVILAHGSFPAHPAALHALRCAKTLVCCDGAAESLVRFGLTPTCVVGDLDSISPEMKRRFADRLCQSAEQESNDLTKAVRVCQARGLHHITLLGATGLREDHTLGNIALLADYADGVCAQMVTDYGVLNAVAQPTTFESYAGQQVSVFRMSPAARVTLAGLRYPLRNSPLPQLWRGTLNEAMGSEFSVSVKEGGKVVVFREHRR